MSSSSRFVSVMGTTGSGKTTAAKLIAAHFHWQLIEENFGDNTFLPRFYKDMARWAFHSQTFFLMEKISQIMSVEGMLTLGSVVQDTPIYQDVYSYAKAHHVLGNMDEAEWRLYQKIFHSFEDFLPHPDLIVYLETSVPVVQKRIKGRGRSYEKEIPKSYLQLLQKHNEEWLNSLRDIKVLKIPTDDLNLVHKKTDQQKFLSWVEEAIQTL